MVDWRHSLEQKWAGLHFGEVKVQTKDNQHFFEVQVYPNGLDLKAVRVELYADGVNGGNPLRQEMNNLRQIKVQSGGYFYSATVSATRPPGEYTARAMPFREGVAIPLEDSRILWQR